MKFWSVVLELLPTDAVKFMGMLLHFPLCMCQQVVYIMVTSPTTITPLFAKKCKIHFQICHVSVID